MRPKTYVPIITLSLLSVQDVYASYIDPGTGSYIIQVLVAGFFGGIFALKLFWKRIKLFFNRKSMNDNDE